MRVVGAVIRREGRVLMARRPPHARHGGLWEFPGGKVERDEDDARALARELLEEFAAPCVVEAPVATGRDGDVELACWRVRLLAEPMPLHHDRLAWVPVADLATLEIPPADQAAVDALLAEARAPAAAVPPATPPFRSARPRSAL